MKNLLLKLAAYVQAALSEPQVTASDLVPSHNGMDCKPSMNNVLDNAHLSRFAQIIDYMDKRDKVEHDRRLEITNTTHKAYTDEQFKGLFDNFSTLRQQVADLEDKYTVVFQYAEKISKTINTDSPIVSPSVETAPTTEEYLS